MSRLGKGRPPLANRLASSLGGQLADIASTIGALDGEPAPPPSAPEDGRRDEPPVADAPDPAGDGLNAVLDEFEFAMDAMLDDRAHVLGATGADEPAPADSPPDAEYRPPDADDEGLPGPATTPPPHR